MKNSSTLVMPAYIAPMFKNNNVDLTDEEYNNLKTFYAYQVADGLARKRGKELPPGTPMGFGFTVGDLKDDKNDDDDGCIKVIHVNDLKPSPLCDAVNKLQRKAFTWTGVPAALAESWVANAPASKRAQTKKSVDMMKKNGEIKQ